MRTKKNYLLRVSRTVAASVAMPIWQAVPPWNFQPSSPIPLQIETRRLARRNWKERESELNRVFEVLIDKICENLIYLRFENCLAIKQAKVGPITAPGNFTSDTPADQRSISSGCLFEINFLVIQIIYL